MKSKLTETSGSQEDLSDANHPSVKSETRENKWGDGPQELISNNFSCSLPPMKFRFLQTKVATTKGGTNT